MEDFLFGDLGSFDSVRAFLPEEIEAESMRIIRGELSRMGISVPAENEKVVLRCIHATADFDFASSLVFSKDAVSKAGLKQGADGDVESRAHGMTVEERDAVASLQEHEGVKGCESLSKETIAKLW